LILFVISFIVHLVAVAIERFPTHTHTHYNINKAAASSSSSSSWNVLIYPKGPKLIR
jgi:hypothetical protein